MTLVFLDGIQKVGKWSQMELMSVFVICAQKIEVSIMSQLKNWSFGIGMTKITIPSKATRECYQCRDLF